VHRSSVPRECRQVCSGPLRTHVQSHDRSRNGIATIRATRAAARLVSVNRARSGWVMKRIQPDSSARPADLNRVVANSGWMITEHVCKALAGLYVSVLLARHFGPSEFGSLNFATAYSALFTIAAAVGLNRILVRELAKSTDATVSDRLVATVVLLRSAAAIL